MTLNEERILKEYIKDIIRETYKDILENNFLQEKFDSIKHIEKHHTDKEQDDNKKTELHKDIIDKHDGNKEANNNKRKRVINKLKNKRTNCADVMRELWKPSKDEEDGARSYFYKCRDGELNDSGVPYEFSDSEINRLYQILNDSF